MKAKIDTNGTMLISKDSIYNDVDDYALAKWVEEWKKGRGCVSIQYEGPGGKTYNQAITPNSSTSKVDGVLE